MTGRWKIKNERAGERQQQQQKQHKESEQSRTMEEN